MFSLCVFINPVTEQLVRVVTRAKFPLGDNKVELISHLRSSGDN